MKLLLTIFDQSKMYRPNDVLINGMRISNIFDTQDNHWHDKYMKPIRGLWTMTKVLEMESLIDETLSKFISKLGSKFAEGSNAGKVCMMDEGLGYCKITRSRPIQKAIALILRFSCLGCDGKYQFRKTLWFH